MSGKTGMEREMVLMGFWKCLKELVHYYILLLTSGRYPDGAMVLTGL